MKSRVFRLPGWLVVCLALSSACTAGDAPPDAAESTADTAEPPAETSETATDTTSAPDTDADPEPDTPEPPPDPVAPGAGELLIEELYYSGAAPTDAADHYFSDQFIELVNASDHPLDLSGVMVGNAWGTAGPINPGTVPDSFRHSHPNHVVLESVWRIPTGVALEPDGRLVIAHDGTNHRPFSTVDLSGASFETWVVEGGKDDDYPTVDNLESVLFNGGYDWLITVFGPSVVVLSADAPLSSIPGPFGDLTAAPTSSVVDAIETLMDADSGDFERLPDTVDTGFAWVSGPYTGESLHRKHDGTTWQDTNDSGADFEVGQPDPSPPPTSAPDPTTGDPWIELGTGQWTFESLGDGDPVELVAGPQGGWHIDVTLRLAGFGPAGIVVTWEATTAESEPISFVTTAKLSPKSVLPDGDGWLRVGDRIVLDISNPAEVVGTTATLHVEATLGADTATDQRTVTIVDEH